MVVQLRNEVGRRLINLYETDQELGVYARVNDDASNIMVTIIYQIVGYDEVFTINHVVLSNKVLNYPINKRKVREYYGCYSADRSRFS